MQAKSCAYLLLIPGLNCLLLSFVNFYAISRWHSHMLRRISVLSLVSPSASFIYLICPPPSWRNLVLPCQLLTLPLTLSTTLSTTDINSHGSRNQSSWPPWNVLISILRTTVLSVSSTMSRKRSRSEKSRGNVGAWNLLMVFWSYFAAYRCPQYGCLFLMGQRANGREKPRIKIHGFCRPLTDGGLGCQPISWQRVWWHQPRIHKPDASKAKHPPFRWLCGHGWELPSGSLPVYWRKGGKHRMYMLGEEAFCV